MTLWSFSPESSRHCQSQTGWARKLKFWEYVPPPPCVTCHISRITCPFFFLRGGASWCRVCYQRGLPSLVFGSQGGVKISTVRCMKHRQVGILTMWNIYGLNIDDYKNYAKNTKLVLFHDAFYNLNKNYSVLPSTVTALCHLHPKYSTAYPRRVR